LTARFPASAPLAVGVAAEKFSRRTHPFALGHMHAANRAGQHAFGLNCAPLRGTRFPVRAAPPPAPHTQQPGPNTEANAQHDPQYPETQQKQKDQHEQEQF
jgi:hypothetical protein